MKKSKVIFAVSLLCFSCFTGGCTEKNAEETTEFTEEISDTIGENTKETTVEESTAADANVQNSDDNYEIVSKGILFHIPKSYDVRIEDETSNIYINDADFKFELVMLVGDGSYEESLKDKEHLMENAKKEDVTITKTVTEYEVEGKSYTYFTFEYNDKSSTNTVVYTAASKNKKIGINFVRNADISEEDVIIQIDTFLHQLEVVDLKDSVQRDIDEADQAPDGQLFDEITLELGESKITTKVTEGYYLVDEFKTEDSYSQLFEAKDQKSSVSTQFFKENYYESAGDYVKEQINVIDAGDSSYSDIHISDLNSLEINGNQVIYSNISYTYDSGGNKVHYAKIVAATVTSGNSLYVLEASALNDEKELKFDDIKDFMTISN